MRKEYTFLYEYSKCKKHFVRPKFKWFIGKWINEPNLPVWRCGPQLKLGKYSDYETKYNYARLVDSWWTDSGKQRHPILSKLFKPVYQLPIWLAFHWYDDDMMYKTKWTESDFRFEFPPHFTIVFFGFAISITAYFPMENDKDFTANDDYWESLLTYNYFDGDLKQTNKELGYYNDFKKGDGQWVFNPRFLKNVVERDDLISIQEKEEKEILNKKDES